MRTQFVRSYTKKDFNIDWFSGQGAGGQHRNRHQNCCRVTHLPSGITKQSTAFKERRFNLRACLHEIAAELKPLLEKDLMAVDAPRSDEVIRTYNTVDNRVIDHASGHKSSWKQLDIDEMIIARKNSVTST